jgi:hypothetical protein
MHRARLLNAAVSTANQKRTESMTTDLVTYLSFDGQCEAAFKYYEKVLGGKILMMMRHADAPAGASAFRKRPKRPTASSTPA